MKRFYTALFSILFIPIIGLAATEELGTTPPGGPLKGTAAPATDPLREMALNGLIKALAILDSMGDEAAAASSSLPMVEDDGIKLDARFTRANHLDAQLCCIHSENNTDLGNNRKYAVESLGSETGEWAPIGTLETAYYGESLDILNFNIDAPYQGQGKGREALLTLFAMYKDNLLPFIKYRLEVPFPETTNKKAFDLYTELGFTEDKEATQEMKDQVKRTGVDPEYYRHLVVMHLPRAQAEALV